MLFTTPEQFIVLAVLLLGGWLIGFASAPSPRKWKRRVREQSDSFTEYHAEAEDRVRAANQRAADLKAEADALRADHAEAERTIGALRAAAAAAPVATVVAEHAHPAPVPAPALVTPAPEPQVAATETAPAVVADHAEMAADPVIEEEPVVAAASPSEATTEAPEFVEPVAMSQPPVEHMPVSDIDHAPHPEPDVDATPATVHKSALDSKDHGAPTHEAVVEEAAAEEPVLDPPASAHEGEHAPPAPMTPMPTEAAPAAIGPAEPEMPSKGWFASSARDDLTLIRGIDGVLNTRLFALGVVRFEDLEKLSAEDEMALEQRLALPVGYIARAQWRTQAALLRAGQDDEHAAHFAATEPVSVGQ